MDRPINDDSSAKHLERLVYTKKIIKESMRLMPAIWAVGREAICDTELGPYKISKDTTVYISTYLMQRLGTYFDNPEQFNPARWTNEFTASLPKHVYSPFGGDHTFASGSIYQYWKR